MTITMYAENSDGINHNADNASKERRMNTCCHALLDNAQECIWTLDVQGRFQYVNNTARKLLGYSLEEWLGKPFTEFVPHAEHSDVNNLLQAVLAGQEKRFEMEVVDHQNRVVMLNCKMTPWREDDKLLGAVSYAVDVTPQRNIEAALELSEKRYRSIVDEGREVHMRFKYDGTILFVNRNWFEPLGKPREAILGKHYSELLPEKPSEHIRETVARLTPEAPRATLQIDLERSDGQPAYYKWTLQAIFTQDTDPRLLEVQVIGRDETQLRNMEAESQKATAQLRKASIQTIQSLFLTVEKKDPYTADHQRRTAFLAAEIAYALELPREQVQGIYFGALIHDIGKLFIPVDILNRPGRISDIEYTLIKTHPQVGYEIIREIDLPWDIGSMILQHHERLDGSGYPNGISGDEICLGARIITVADVVESIASNRPYRPKLELINAIDEIIRYRGTHFDPEIVDVCLELIESRRIDINRLDSSSAFN